MAQQRIAEWPVRHYRGTAAVPGFSYTHRSFIYADIIYRSFNPREKRPQQAWGLFLGVIPEDQKGQTQLICDLWSC